MISISFYYSLPKFKQLVHNVIKKKAWFFDAMNSPIFFAPHLQSETAALLSCFVTILKDRNHMEEWPESVPDVGKFLIADRLWFSRPWRLYVPWCCRAVIFLKLDVPPAIFITRFPFFLSDNLTEKRKFPNNSIDQLGKLVISPPPLSHKIQIVSLLSYSNLKSCSRNLFVEYDYLHLLLQILARNFLSDNAF